MAFHFAGRGDNGFWWRMQEPRSLADIDQLLQRQVVLREAIGATRAEEIEKEPELLADWEQFRLFHAKARFRSTITTAGAVYLGSVGAAQFLGYPSGRALIR